jgi:hypothetical protein
VISEITVWAHCLCVSVVGHSVRMVIKGWGFLLIILILRDLFFFLSWWIYSVFLLKLNVVTSLPFVCVRFCVCCTVKFQVYCAYFIDIRKYFGDWKKIQGLISETFFIPWNLSSVRVFCWFYCKPMLLLHVFRQTRFFQNKNMFLDEAVLRGKQTA